MSIGKGRPRRAARTAPALEKDSCPSHGSGNSLRTKHALLAVNFVGAAAAAVFAARGMARPGYVQPTAPMNSVARFWAASSAVRTWAIAVPLLGGLVRPGPLPYQLLTVAGLVQLSDATLGIWQRKLDMTLAPAAMGLIHVVSAHRLSRHC